MQATRAMALGLLFIALAAGCQQRSAPAGATALPTAIEGERRAEAEKPRDPFDEIERQAAAEKKAEAAEKPTRLSADILDEAQPKTQPSPEAPDTLGQIADGTYRPEPEPGNERIRELEDRLRELCDEIEEAEFQVRNLDLEASRFDLENWRDVVPDVTHRITVLRRHLESIDTEAP